MARQRDYAAEYRRRVALEEQRAKAEGRAPDRAAARGHVSRETENRRRRISTLEKRSRYGLPPAEYHRNVTTTIDQQGTAQVERWMREKIESTEDFYKRVDDGMTYTEAATESLGRTRYLLAQSLTLGFVQASRDLFFYHGNR